MFLFAYVLVSLACFMLVAVSGLKLAALVKGAIEVRKGLADGADHGEGPFLKSPLVPAIAVIAAPPDASSESREYVKRLLALHASNVEVVVALDDPSEADRAVSIKIWARSLLPSARPGAANQAGSDPLCCASAMSVNRCGEGAWGRGGLPQRCYQRLRCSADRHGGPRCALFESRSNVPTPAHDGLLDETIGVCGAAPMPLQASGLAARIHQIEFLQSRFLKCAALSAWNALLPPTGSLVLLRRDALIGIQGFTGSLLETVVHLHGFSRATKRPYRIRFVPQPVSSPRLPKTWAERGALLERDRF